jgi:surfactin synthase thioesterase subunit
MRIEAMAEAALASFSGLMDQPFAVFGHSLGAVVAAEFVRVLQTRGMSPTHLFVSSRPPHRSTTRQLHQLPDLDFISAMNERYQGIPKEILAEEDLLMLLLPALRADVEALETFSHANGAKLTCPITAYGGDSDPTVSRLDLEAWNNETISSCRIRMFVGDHFYLNAQPQLLLTDLSMTLQLCARSPIDCAWTNDRL